MTVATIHATPSAPSRVAFDYERHSAVEPFSVSAERWLALTAELMTVERFRAGEVIFHAGDTSDAIYVVCSGRVTVFTDTMGEPAQLLARVPAGQMFGEVGVLERSPRAVTARAACDSELLRLERRDLARLGRTNRRFGARLARCALVNHKNDSARKLELGKRSEVRIRLEREVDLTSAGCESLTVVLDNLSLRGACLRCVPEDWEIEAGTRVRLSLKDGTELFEVEAEIAWRQGTSIGLTFHSRRAAHWERIETTVDLLLGDPPPTGDLEVA